MQFWLMINDLIRFFTLFMYKTTIELNYIQNERPNRTSVIDFFFSIDV